MFQILPATTEHMPVVRELFLEYARSLDFDLCFQGFDQELAHLPGDYAAPTGVILMAWTEKNVAAGVIAVRPYQETIAEMKRLFVRPDFQGRGVGRQLTVALLEYSQKMGYEKIRLDTVPSMKAAIAMYESMGFYEIEPYRENPVPGTRYFEKSLR